MFDDGRDWYNKRPGATEQQLADLRAASPLELPQRLYEALAHSNGGEGPLPVQPLWFVLHSTEEIIWSIEDAAPESEYANFMIFGSNGASEFVAFDLRTTAPHPIVYIDMIAGKDSAEQIAPDFEAFWALVGVNGEN